MPLKAIKRLSEYGLLKVIHPNLGFSERMEAILQSVHDSLSWFNLLFLEEKPDKGAIYLMAMLSVLNPDDRESAFVRLSMPSKIKGIINKGISDASELIRTLPLRDPAKIYRSISGLNIEAILFAMAVAVNENKKKEISRYLIELRHVKPQTTGTDLGKMGVPPGPVYSEILNALLDERLRGKLKTKEDELAFLKQEINKRQKSAL